MGFWFNRQTSHRTAGGSVGQRFYVSRTLARTILTLAIEMDKESDIPGQSIWRYQLVGWYVGGWKQRLNALHKCYKLMHPMAVIRNVLLFLQPMYKWKNLFIVYDSKNTINLFLLDCMNFWGSYNWSNESSDKFIIFIVYFFILFDNKYLHNYIFIRLTIYSLIIFDNYFCFFSIS